MPRLQSAKLKPFTFLECKEAIHYFCWCRSVQSRCASFLREDYNDHWQVELIGAPTDAVCPCLFKLCSSSSHVLAPSCSSVTSLAVRYQACPPRDPSLPPPHRGHFPLFQFALLLPAPKPWHPIQRPLPCALSNVRHAQPPQRRSRRAPGRVWVQVIGRSPLPRRNGGSRAALRVLANELLDLFVRCLGPRTCQDVRLSAH